MNIIESKSVRYDGVKISNITYSDVFNEISTMLEGNCCGYICVNDVNNIMVATSDDDMRNAVNGSLLSLADGMPLVWFAKLAGCSQIERITGMDLMQKIFKEEKSFRHFLLGDTIETMDKVIAFAKSVNENIVISGYCPEFSDISEINNKEIFRHINEFNAEIVWVSFGGGKQEKWMINQISSLRKGVMIGVGAAFRWLIGDIPVPPRFIQMIGCQWIYRFAHEFYKSPKLCILQYRQRNIFINKVKFLFNFPLQIIKARNINGHKYYM